MTSDSRDTDSDMTEKDADSRLRNERPTDYYAWDPKIETELPPTALGIAWSGIVLAAACYPIVVEFIQLGWMTIAYGSGSFSPDMLGRMLGLSMVSLITGLVYGIIMSIPAFLFTVLLSMSFRGIVSDRGASGIYGGMTGFLCTSWGGLLTFILVDGPPGYEGLLFLVPVSILAVVMGHVGAILAGYRRRHDGFPFFNPIFSFEKQITIGYLMKLTVLVAVLVIAFKAAGSAGLCIGITWLVYLLVQMLLLIVEHWITRWLKPC